MEEGYRGSITALIQMNGQSPSRCGSSKVLYMLVAFLCSKTAKFDIHVSIWDKHSSAAAISQGICTVYGLKKPLLVLVMSEQVVRGWIP